MDELGADAATADLKAVTAPDAVGLDSWLELGVLPDRADPAGARLTADELLGRGILRLRLYWGWSQRDVEARSGVDQSTLCRLEAGARANVGSRRLSAILKALMVADVIFLPRRPASPPTQLEVMLHGDPWERALAEADRRVNRRRSA